MWWFTDPESERHDYSVALADDLEALWRARAVEDLRFADDAPVNLALAPAWSWCQPPTSVGRKGKGKRLPARTWTRQPVRVLEDGADEVAFSMDVNSFATHGSFTARCRRDGEHDVTDLGVSVSPDEVSKPMSFATGRAARAHFAQAGAEARWRLSVRWGDVFTLRLEAHAIAARVRCLEYRPNVRLLSVDHEAILSLHDRAWYGDPSDDEPSGVFARMLDATFAVDAFAKVEPIRWGEVRVNRDARGAIALITREPRCSAQVRSIIEQYPTFEQGFAAARDAGYTEDQITRSTTPDITPLLQSWCYDDGEAMSQRAERIVS